MCIIRTYVCVFVLHVQANLEMKHEQQRQVAIDSKVKMQEELLTEVCMRVIQ